MPVRPELLATAGRVAIGGSFIVFGFTKLLAVEGTIAFIGRSGMPAPELVFYLSIAIEAGLGLALLLGFRAREIAAFLAFYCVFIGVVFHNEFGDRGQRDQFLKNIVMAGGLLQIAAYGVRARLAGDKT